MQQFLAHCSAAFSGQGTHLFAFFLAGLAGSLTHCLVMCGPKVACQAACSRGCGRDAAQWEYHAGRFLAYGGMGFAAALLARQIQAYAFWPRLSSALLIVAGVLFLVSSIYGTPMQQHPRFARSGNFLRGLLMSFMPCGLIYAALMVAATFGSPLKAMVAMWLFVLGTLPALLLSSSGAALLARRWQHGVSRAGRALMAFNGLSLIAMAIGFVR
jgi:sulfite exporter TauE/SafE